MIKNLFQKRVICWCLGFCLFGAVPAYCQISSEMIQVEEPSYLLKKKVKKMYRQISSAYKGKRYEYALKNIEVLEDLIKENNQYSSCFLKITDKLNKMKDNIYIINAEQSLTSEKKFFKSDSTPIPKEVSLNPGPAIQKASKKTRGELEGADNVVFTQHAILKKEILAGVEDLYQDGVELYRLRSFELAQDVLTEVDNISPNYKLTRHYLNILTEYQKIEKSREQYYENHILRPAVIERYGVVTQALDSLESQSSSIR